MSDENVINLLGEDLKKNGLKTLAENIAQGDTAFSIIITVNHDGEAEVTASDNDVIYITTIFEAVYDDYKDRLGVTFKLDTDE